MRLFYPTFLLLLAPLVSSHVLAQQAPQRDAQAVALLAQSQAVVGAAAGAQDSYAEGTFTRSDGTQGTIVIKTKGLSMLRHEITVNGQQSSHVVNQGKGYAVRGGKKGDLPLWMTLYQRAEHIPALSLLTEFQSPNFKVSYVGVEDVAGRPAHHIRLWALPTDDTPARVEEIISEFHLFVDAQTLLVVKTRTYDFSPEAIENRTAVDTYYADYRPVAGLLIPFHVTRYLTKQTYTEIIFSTVRLNVGLSDSEFQ
jgi:hypothetical protein